MLQHLEHLFQQSSKDVSQWFTDIQDTSEAREQDVNWWLYIAERARVNILFDRNTHREEQCEWAKIALRAYEQAARAAKRSNQSTLSGISLEVSAMMLRLRVIKELDIQNDQDTMSIPYVEDWFFQRIPMSITDAQKAAQKGVDWKSEEGISFAVLRNMMQVGSLLLEDDRSMRKDDLLTWKSILDTVKLNS